ncbi:MAG: DUF697 domain-containing protein [Lentisphaerae bacterium]|nr:DUF697 domain-containing protein [Lentisphaerota bacterium]
MFQRLWRMLVAVTLAVGVLLSFFAIIELLRAYVILRSVHPMLGAAFAIAMLIGIIAGAVWYVVTMGSRPCALRQPPRVDPGTADARALRTYARYQVSLLRRLSRNPQLHANLQDRVRRQRARLREALAAGDDAADLRRCVRDADDQTIAAALDPLDALARHEISRTVRDVMLAVTLSPWRSADLAVVVYRNLRLVARLSTIYNTRPPLREQIAILRDVFAVVATVNFLNYGSNLLQNLTSSVPVLGRFADDVAEGVGAGLLTSVAGHAAMGRCRSYGRWDQDAAAHNIGTKLRLFLDDVKRIVTHDVLDRIRRPIEAQIPEHERSPHMTDDLRGGITEAIDATTSVMDTFLLHPLAAAGRGVVDTGTVVGRAVAQGGAWTWRGMWSGVRSMGRGMRRSIGQVQRSKPATDSQPHVRISPRLQ